ncbi:MAG: AAA family ATPase [Gemmatimonadetes bacterium]|nr:AAA family ATPase [Gemmatimonadota bacterium]
MQYLRSVRLRRGEVRSWDEYPFDLPAVRNLDRMELHPDVTFLIGENGSGKSTLLEGIAVRWGFNPEGGPGHLNFETRASHSALSRYLELGRGGRPYDGYFLRAESFFNVATRVEEVDAANHAELPPLGRPLREFYGDRPLHEQSHGESFFALLTERFGGGGLYILDEPEAALSPMRQMAALVRMRDLVRMKSQFLIATHSPILMAYPGARILLLEEGGIREVPYEETEHYVVTREFLNNPAGMLRELMS